VQNNKGYTQGFAGSKAAGLEKPCNIKFSEVMHLACFKGNVNKGTKNHY
jgi:hypothetical protein